MNTIILEETEDGEVAIDIYSKLSSDRVLFLHGPVDERVATDIVATLLLKDAETDEEKISLFINSEGGDIRSIFMIYDVLRLINSPLETVCVGSAMDEIVLLLAAGTKGMRYATQNSLICPSQLISTATQFSDLSDALVLMERLKRDNKNYMQALAKCTGKKLKDISKDLERKKFFDAKQAKQYGLIDRVVRVSNGN